MKIILCTMAINEWYRDVVKYSIRNMNNYCLQHNYEFILYTEESDGIFEGIYDKQRPPCWYKIQFIKRILCSDKEFDYLVWLDADTQIINETIKLEYFIDKYFTKEDNELDLVIIEEFCKGNFNTGLMFLKKTENNIKLMDKIWDNDKVTDYFKKQHEQSSFQMLYDSDKEIAKHVYIIPYETKTDLIVYWGQFDPIKSFIVHVAGCSDDLLGLYYMIDLFYKHKLEEESIEEYRERSKFLFDKEIADDYINKWNNRCMHRIYSARVLKKFKMYPYDK